MKNLKFFGVLLLALTFSSTSCKKKEITSNENVATFSFETNRGNETLEANLISTKPLKIQSEDLVVKEAVNQETEQAGFVITLKASLKPTHSAKIGGPVGSIERGYWYDGYDCFVYGTIITANDGSQAFIPADVATQYLMNECGYANVA